MNKKRLILTASFLLSLSLFLGTFGFKGGIDTTPFWNLMAGAYSESDSRLVNYAVKKGDTFSTVMSKFGIDRQKANNILSKAKDIYDFTGITAGNIFQFSIIEGFVNEIRYDVDREDQIVVKSIDREPKIKEQDIKYERVQREAGSEVNRSLFLDGREAGLEDKTILEMAEIFAWDVDFAADIREGDEFSVVYDDLYRDGSYIGPGRIKASKFKNKGDNHFAFYFKNGEEKGKYYNLEGKAVQRQFLKSPLTYSYISSGFSYNRLNPVTRSSYGPHRAIDYSASPGTRIYATGKGRVSYAGWGRGLGLYVKISHGGVYDTVYAHMSGLASSIRTGVSVSQGQVLGFVGSTGYATGPHLHYEMRKYGQRINPLTHKLPPGKPIKEEKRDEFEEIVEKYKPMLQ